MTSQTDHIFADKNKTKYRGLFVMLSYLTRVNIYTSKKTIKDHTWHSCTAGLTAELFCVSQGKHGPRLNQ